MHFGHTKSLENATSGRKCRLVPVSRLDLVEPFDGTGGTFKFPGTLIKNTGIG